MDDTIEMLTELETFSEQGKSLNTVKKTKHDVGLFESFIDNCKDIQLSKDSGIEDLPVEQLNTLLARFLVSLKKPNGKEYEPCTIRSIVCSIERYLQEKGYKYSLNKSAEFDLTRQAMSTKIKDLKVSQRIRCPSSSRGLTNDEINVLYKLNIMGLQSPKALLNLVWWNNCCHFGLWVCREHYALKWGDVKLLTSHNSDGRVVKYVQYTQKARLGGQTMTWKMWETSGDPADPRDPVSAYLLYRHHRPETMQDKDSPFYLAANHKNIKGANTDCYDRNAVPFQWFKPVCLGINSLGNLMRSMFAAANLEFGDRKLKSLSAMKTRKAAFKKANAADTNIILVSGPTNNHSFNSYNNMRNERGKDMASMLHGSSGDGNGYNTSAGPSNPYPVTCVENFPRVCNNSHSCVNDVGQEFKSVAGFLPGDTNDRAIYVSAESKDQKEEITDEIQELFLSLGSPFAVESEVEISQPMTPESKGNWYESSNYSKSETEELQESSSTPQQLPSLFTSGSSSAAFGSSNTSEVCRKRKSDGLFANQVRSNYSANAAEDTRNCDVTKQFAANDAEKGVEKCEYTQMQLNQLKKLKYDLQIEQLREAENHEKEKLEVKRLQKVKLSLEIEKLRLEKEKLEFEVNSIRSARFSTL